jgi:hypothetical protein
MSQPQPENILNAYLRQYVQTSRHINNLRLQLEEIHANILDTIMNTTRRQNNIQNVVSYDYTRPIGSRFYESSNTDNFVTLLNNVLSSTRTNSVPTTAQIDNATRLVRYENIETPVTDTCPICLEQFQNSDVVRQIIHCGHIFNQQHFNRWFERDSRCPVCRYDIRNTDTDTDNNGNADTDNNGNDTNFESMVNNLFQSILNPNMRTNERFMIDPSNNLLLYETILRPNNI